MDAIDDLKTGHEAARQALDILKEIVENINATGNAEHPEHLEQLFDFFRIFVDRCHHGKEEELLFPALEEIGISREGGPVGVMLSEHQQGCDLVAQMKTDLARLLHSDDAAVRLLKQHATDYITLLNFHIDRENSILFRLASTHLPPDKLAELGKGFDRIETEKIGYGRHEAFHRMLAAFSNLCLR